ncbi:DUF7344 domain-containing protein [Natrinema amylolyticum]|uniref:DUF7344 domain-containing protein n=1 Tax=Natrinema amylolyticum TaxID=2878679 RepID=UPI001CF9B6D3|nr:hypothetical protein [Natrinema amylolyticum]
MVDTGEIIDDDEIFDALAARYRRRLLVELLTRDRRDIEKLTGISRAVADADGELLRKTLSNSRSISGADEKLLEKHHVHLPKLAEYGFIEWDREDHVVTKGPRFDDVRPLLELVDGQRERAPAEFDYLIVGEEPNSLSQSAFPHD